MEVLVVVKGCRIGGSPPLLASTLSRPRTRILPGAQLIYALLTAQTLQPARYKFTGFSRGTTMHAISRERRVMLKATQTT